MMASSSQTPVLHRNSCAECQRRKQKVSAIEFFGCQASSGLDLSLLQEGPLSAHLRLLSVSDQAPTHQSGQLSQALRALLAWP